MAIELWSNGIDALRDGLRKIGCDSTVRIGGGGRRAVTALLAFVAHKLQSARLTARLRDEADAQIKALSAEQADHAKRSANANRPRRDGSPGRAVARGVGAAIGQRRRAARDVEAATDDKDQWAHQARQIAGEAARLKSLGATFERWHEQMISLMTQNHDMHARIRSSRRSSGMW